MENLRGPLRSYCTKFGKQNLKYKTKGFQSCFKCKSQHRLNCGLATDTSIVPINPVLSVMRRFVIRSLQVKAAHGLLLLFQPVGLEK